MPRVALDSLLLGLHGEISAGEAVPAEWEDLLGGKHKTDFKSLEALGLVEPEKKPGTKPAQ